jgi:mRNA interferase RelE/StbE
MYTYGMVLYEDNIKKSVKKGALPKDVFERYKNVFIALDKTNDLGLFDIKKLKSSENRTYYRLRKGKYRAIFYIEDNNYYVISIAKREEVYKKWE